MASFFIIVKLENRFLSLLNAPSRSVFVCFNFIASFSQFLFKVSTLAVMLFSFVNTTETEKDIKVATSKMDTKIQCTLLFIRCKLRADEGNNSVFESFSILELMKETIVFLKASRFYLF